MPILVNLVLVGVRGFPLRGYFVPGCVGDPGLDWLGNSSAVAVVVAAHGMDGWMDDGWMMDGYRIQESGYRMQDTGCRIQNKKNLEGSQIISMNLLESLRISTNL